MGAIILPVCREGKERSVGKLEIVIPYHCNWRGWILLVLGIIAQKEGLKDQKGSIKTVVGMFCRREAPTSSRSGVPVVRWEDPCLGVVGNVGINTKCLGSRI